MRISRWSFAAALLLAAVVRADPPAASGPVPAVVLEAEEVPTARPAE